MKILTLHMTYFRLPDDFSGSISDALRAMADYRDSVASTSKHKPMLPLHTPLSEAFGLMFDEFIDETQNGKRLVGMIQLNDFDPKVKVADL
ncbi:MAG: hypothetical protein WC919_00490 [Candidatus Paceibacterota bacterium]|jgi:hypothetical protein